MTRDEVLKLLNEDLKNEWTHLQFYLYSASAVTGLHAAEYREFLTDAAKGEMEHVQQFQDRIWGLLGTPAFGSHAFPVYTRPENILIAAHTLERQVIATYAQRIGQVAELDAPEAQYLAIFYEAQLQDSYEDAERIQRLLADLEIQEPLARKFVD